MSLVHKRVPKPWTRQYCPSNTQMLVHAFRTAECPTSLALMPLKAMVAACISIRMHLYTLHTRPLDWLQAPSIVYNETNRTNTHALGSAYSTLPLNHTNPPRLEQCPPARSSAGKGPRCMLPTALRTQFYACSANQTLCKPCSRVG